MRRKRKERWGREYRREKRDCMNVGVMGARRESSGRNRKGREAGQERGGK